MRETNASNLRFGPQDRACWDKALGSRSYIDNACPRAAAFEHYWIAYLGNTRLAASATSLLATKSFLRMNDTEFGISVRLFYWIRSYI